MGEHNDRTDLLIFDLDGTLYCTESSFVPTMREVYSEYGIPYPGDDAVLGQVGETFSTYLDWLTGQGFPNDHSALARRITELELVAIAERGRLFPGVRETLEALRDAGCRIALCTNGDRRYAELVLSSCGILDLFDALQTNDGDRTTKADRVRQLLTRVEHGRAFMIGDRYHDVEAGRANRCTVIGAAYGYGGEEELAAADLRIERFADLRSVIA